MRLLVMIGVLSMFCFLTTACFNGGATAHDSQPNIPKPADRVTWQWLNDDAAIVRYTMDNGKVLVCAEDYASDGGLGLSCNWAQFNKDSGR